MPQYSVANLCKDVRIVLGENENVEQLLTGEGIYDDQLQLERDTLIDSLVTKAIDRVHSLAPLNVVSSVSVDADLEINYEDDDYCMFSSLPSNYLRLVSAKSVEWKKTVNTAIDEFSELYSWQRSDFKSVRATKRNPIVAIVPSNDDSGLRIEMFPKDEASTVEDPSIMIVKRASSSNGNINIANDCYNAVVYTIAYLYYETINEAEKAQRMAAEAAVEMGFTNK